MASDRALVFPGLVPLTRGELTAVLDTRDELLELAEGTSGFAAQDLDVTDGHARLSSTVHESLLAVALLRRVAAEGRRWTAYGGMSAGCVPSLLAAGVITEETCFRLIRDINETQIAAKAARPNGITLALLPSSEGDAERLVEVLATADDKPWLSVDLGAGLIALAFRGDDAEALTRRLGALGTAVLDRIDRAEHCPWALPGPDVFAELLAGADFRPATAAVVSPLTGKRVDDTPEAYRRMLTEQWFDTASLPRLVDGLCAVDSVTAVDLVGPAKSVYVPRVRAMTAGRADHRLLTIAG
ncbi:hypothetical protein [Streptomyces aureus]|uniref:hypothetical protein n=1 Tax=Streptomyces aureus TaxID=193461 RepID=UPI0006E18F59|nr:hypothetical protein [Streptomyces aureus]